MSPARARTRTARSGDERTNHEATEPPTLDLKLDENKKNSLKYRNLVPLALQRTEWDRGSEFENAVETFTHKQPPTSCMLLRTFSI